MDQKEILLLIERYNSGKCTAEETALLEGWYLSRSKETSSLSNSEVEEIEKQLLANLEQHINKSKTKKPVKLWQRISWAAAVLLVLSTGLFFYLEKSNAGNDLAQGDHILPGTNKATLLLADGKTINLNEASNGKLAEQGGITIKKTSAGEVVYTIDPAVAQDQPDAGQNPRIAFNTITTPKAGQFQLILPDGTKIWLNAASTLQFPGSFAGLHQRRVKLSGEAYFEVSKNKKMPFIVETTKQEVEVLGTHFNVNSYVDEPGTKTVLLEGSVKITPVSAKNTPAKTTLANAKTATVKRGMTEYSVVLKPGQQAVLKSNEQLSVSPADLEEAVAWKKGFFQFENASIETVLRQLSRWYDVDVQYEKPLPDGNFTGKIYRNLTLSEALRGIGFTGVNFKVKERRVIVTK